MRNMPSPLVGVLSPFGRISGSGVADAYAIGGASPELVAAFTLASDGTTAGEYFRKASSETTFGDLFTFSRSGTATYFDSNGTLQTAADGVARRNAYYYNAAWVKGGLQLESAAATNLYANSVGFTGWGTTRSTISQSSVTGPDGIANSGHTISGNGSGTNSSFVSNSGWAVSTSTYYTTSSFFKAGDTSWVALAVLNFTTPANAWAYFDLVNGAVGTVGAGLTANIESFGSGWYRCSVTFLTDATDTSGDIRIYLSDGDGDLNINLDVAQSIYQYGFQFEQGSIPSSYIPTTGSTVTRAAETLSIAGADTPANTTAMSISMKGRFSFVDNGNADNPRLLYWAAAFDNLIRIYNSSLSTRTGVFTGQQRVTSNTKTFEYGETYSPGINVPFNVASRHLSDRFALASEGVASVETTGAGLADLSAASLLIGDTGFNGFISEFRMWGSDIGDSGIEEVTS